MRRRRPTRVITAPQRKEHPRAQCRHSPANRASSAGSTPACRGIRLAEGRRGNREPRTTEGRHDGPTAVSPAGGDGRARRGGQPGRSPRPVPLPRSGPRAESRSPQYPNRDWERIYRDIFRHDRTFTFLCAPERHPQLPAARLREEQRPGAHRADLRLRQGDGPLRQPGLARAGTRAAARRGWCSGAASTATGGSRAPSCGRASRNGSSRASRATRPPAGRRRSLMKRGWDGFVRVPYEEAYALHAKALENIARTYSGEQGQAATSWPRATTRRWWRRWAAPGSGPQGAGRHGQARRHADLRHLPLRQHAGAARRPRARGRRRPGAGLRLAGTPTPGTPTCRRATRWCTATRPRTSSCSTPRTPTSCWSGG